jgi:hypothetical protein
MVGVRERPPAADGDEAGVAIFGEDHGGNAAGLEPLQSLRAARRAARLRARGGVIALVPPTERLVDGVGCTRYASFAPAKFNRNECHETLARTVLSPSALSCPGFHGTMAGITKGGGRWLSLVSSW